MKIRSLYLSAALPALAVALSLPAFAQVSITDERTTPVVSSTAATDGSASDVTIDASGSVVVTSGVAVTLDSDNTIINNGVIRTTDVNDTTGILVSGAVTGTVTNTGRIELSEAFPDGGITAGGNIAQGSGRVGILISGASPFTGNIDNQAGSTITVNGQDSAGIRLADMSSITGNILQAGDVSVYGERSTAIDILGDVIGNLAISGAVNAAGEDSQAVHVAGDVSGGVSITSTVRASAIITAAGATIGQRPSLVSRESLISTGSVRQVGSAVEINGNLGNGLHFAQVLNDAGVATSQGTVAMFGSAPAVLIDGQGTPIALGRVGLIIDPTDADYDEGLQYAFINQGELTADAILDDMNATTFSVADARLEGGIRNTGTMQSTVYRSGIDPAATAATQNSHARVIVIGGGAIAERINNTGTIIARGLDATDSIYADADNVLAANTINVTAIEIDAGGSLSEITNLGSITALITGRNGEAVAVRDASGTLITINNSSIIQSGATSSDATGAQATNFNLIAIDVSANTSGFTLNQTVFTDPDTAVESTPFISGSILLGSGDDTVNVAGGAILSETLSFGDGADTLSISNSASVTAALTDSDGQLDIMVTDGGRLNVTGSTNIDATSASFDATTTYSPFIDPATGDASTIVASGDVTFEDGAVIAPILASVLDNPNAVFTIAEAGGALNIDTALGSLRSDRTPFLYNTTFSRSASDANTLVMTLDVRTAQELGLDVTQTGLFTSAFEALQNSNSLGSAFVNITDQTSFNAAYNQLLPEFASASRQFVMANVDGATGAVGGHLNNARRSQDQPGGAWIEEFVYYADRSLAGLSEQYRGYGFGVTGGFDTSFGPFHTAGLNLGFATTEVEDVLGVDDPLDVLTLQAGLYAGYQTGNLGIDIYGGVGYNDFEANRNVVIGSFSETTNSDWSGTHFNGSISAGYDIPVGKKFFVRPSASATYLSLREKGYIEEGTSGIELDIDDRTVNTATASLMLDIGARFEKDRSWFAPSLRVGLRNEFINDGVITTGRFVNGATNFLIESEEFPNTGILLGITFAAGSGYSSFSFDLDSDIRDGYSRHTARLVLRLLF